MSERGVDNIAGTSNKHVGARSFRYTQPFSKLSNEQRSFYEQNGYILIKKNVDDDLLDKISARFAEICEDESGKYNVFIHKDPSLRKKGLKGEFVINKIQDFVYDPVLWEYCTDPKVLDIAEAIVGPNLTVIHSMLINKPPDADPKFSLHPLHQDLLYFPLRPIDSIVGIWTAMEKVNESNGCLYVVPGSHLKEILYKHGYPENSKHVLYHGIPGMGHLPRLNVEMEKGDTLYFHPLLLHGSGPNLTKGFRKAISCHYADTNASFIDVRGTPQESIGDEVMALMRKRGIDATLSDIWQAKSRVARGIPGTFRINTSHL